MLFSALRFGFLGVRRNFKLALLAWCTLVLLLLPAVISFCAWWWTSLQYHPEATRFIRSLELRPLLVLVEKEHSSLALLIIVAFASSVIVAFLLNALLAGGTLAVLVGDLDPRHPDLVPPKRFVFGARRYFWPLLRVLFITVIAGSTTIAVTSSVFNALLAPYDDSLSLLLDYISLFLPWVIGFMLSLFFFVFGLDFARIEVVYGKERRALVAWWRGVVFSLRHFGRILVIWTLALFLLLVLVVGFTLLPVAATLLLAPIVGILLTSWLRIAVLAGELQLYHLVKSRSELKCSQ